MSRFIAFYLPQYHPIPENDQWWGKGFTEWTNVAKARPLFRGHQQPNIPADLGFYDLRLEESRIQQAEMAKKYGVEGFCYWHYWFGDGRRLLEKPFEDVIKSGKPDFPICLGWANHSWEKKTWDSEGNSELLIEQQYPGEKDYINHFNSLLPAFKDKRYIKVNGKLLFFVFNPLGFPDMAKFIEIWRDLAIKNGFDGIHFVARDADCRFKEKNLKLGFDAIYNDDAFNIHHQENIIKKVYYWVNRNLLKRPTIFLYKDAVKFMVSDKNRENNVIPVIAPNFDHSPRSSGKAIILHKPHPKYFKVAIKNALEIVSKKPKEEQIIVIKSWNEWGEGNYLEPDLRFGKGNLEMLKECLDEINLKST